MKGPIKINVLCINLMIFVFILLFFILCFDVPDGVYRNSYYFDASRKINGVGVVCDDVDDDDDVIKVQKLSYSFHDCLLLNVISMLLYAAGIFAVKLF